MVRHKAFVLASIVLLAASAPALAQSSSSPIWIAEAMQGYGVLLSNPQSIQSETTMGLMQNEGDFIWEPAELGMLQGWKRDRTIGNKWDSGASDDGGWFLISNLGNTVAQDTYQIGTWGKLGPGNLAIVAAFNKSDSDSTSGETYGYREAFYTIDGDPPRWSAVAPSYDYSYMDDEAYKSESKAMDLYVAYGLPIGEAGSLGFSWRHGSSKVTPEDYVNAYSQDYVDYDYVGDPPVSVVTETGHIDVFQSAKEEWDGSSDQLAVEFKMRMSDDFSFKLRGSYTKIDQDLKFTVVDHPYNMSNSARTPAGGSCFDSYSGACNSLYESFDTDGTLLWSEAESAYGVEAMDLSFDGNEWGLGGKINWYNGADGFQFDFGYAKGDFDMKNSRPHQATGVGTYLYSELLEGDTDLTVIYDDRFDYLSYSALGATDLSTTTWFAGGKYMWQWDNADFLLGLRYSQRKSEVDIAGPWVEEYTEEYNTLVEVDPDTYDTDLYFDQYLGRYAMGGTIDDKYIDLPLAAIVHATDKLAFLFGVQHTLFTRKVVGSDYDIWDSSNGSYTYNDELVTDYVDDVSYERFGSSEWTKVNDSYTVYRLGMQYKVNDHVVADLMASDTSGGDNNRENTGLKRIVAGVSVRF